MGILAPVTKMFFSKSGKMIILVTVKRAGVFMNCCLKKQISYNHALRIAENSCIYAFGSQIGMQCILHIQNIVFIYILYTCICVTHRSYTLNSKIANKSNFHRSNVQLVGKCSSNSIMFQERAVRYVHRVYKPFVNPEHIQGNLTNTNIHFCFHGLTDYSSD